MELELSALLSHALIAFTIEFDNEFEHAFPHRTSNAGSRANPWLISLVMYENCMRYVDRKGITVGELVRLARTHTNLDGMRRWGYVTLEPQGKGKPLGANCMIRATEKGQLAREVWQPMFATIEERWQQRFGVGKIARLRGALEAITRTVDIELPDCLPILGYGLLTLGRRPGEDRFKARTASPEREDPARLPLSALFCRTLLALAIGYERNSHLSLAISANVLRLLEEGAAMRVRELPLRSGVSKEAIAMALSYLEKRGFIVVEPAADGGRGKTVRLTHSGCEARETDRRVLSAIEIRFVERFGEENVRSLRESLETQASLLRGMERHAEGWRASARRPQTLPRYPMVLHRGGFPDGS